ncbi:hypothetical protein [Paenibacillus alkalitolerans]|uniref:hypothetical protein n=1 Tax=Paenibacillus alkalitolerans TaxID=2799335 RepID=UPI0018F4C2A8|nr:hypothetical protein [Paenibacillus alkalitolerans]
MNSLIDIAVSNNISWCGIVCDSHGIAQTSNKRMWGVLSKAPDFYPDIITSSRQVTNEDIREFFGDRSISGIKDSFANLDLTALGFQVLFEAEWIFHPPFLNVEPVDTLWCIITTEEQYSIWSAASGLEHVIKPDLLKRDDVKIFMREKDGAVSGFIASLGANAVGVSNVYSVENGTEQLWPEIAKIVSTVFPDLPLVGYEHGDFLEAALTSGWTSIGPLRVWLKTNV